ncbi:MAG: sigma-54-dependent Fis family transcriptional regulator, partial [Planctomycetota bacterium]
MSWNAETTDDQPIELESEDSMDELEETSQSPEGEVLVVNRDSQTRINLQRALFSGNRCTTSVTTREEALAFLRRSEPAAVIVCIENAQAADLIAAIRTTYTNLAIIAFAKMATPELVRDLMQMGADDVLFGPVRPQELNSRLESCRRERSQGSSARLPSSEAARNASEVSGAATKAGSAKAKAPSTNIIRRHPKMKKVFDIAERVAPCDSTVLVQGESGTGKELVARWVHEHSARKDVTFVELNCGALPENLLESQLFGHEKGSFTGAVHRQLGLFEVADGGTIFLDEIGEMSPDMQVKLLRVLQTREFRRIGGSQLVKVDVRVLAATNRDLKQEVDAGRFRADLFYRLNVIC